MLSCFTMINHINNAFIGFLGSSIVQPILGEKCFNKRSKTVLLHFQFKYTLLFI